MKIQKIFTVLLLAALLLAPATLWAAAQGETTPEILAPTMSSAFTYQGRLTDGGLPANGLYDFTFALYDAESGGAQMGILLTADDVSVTNGLFTVPLDFGFVAFNDNSRWLEISVRPGASVGGYTPLSPRQPLTPTPYALYSHSADLLDGYHASDFADSGHGHDHGALTGLGNDDHPQYFALSQNETVSGVPAFNGGATGSSAPFSVDSTFLVANLNADYLNGYHATAFALSSHDHWGQTWSGSGNGLTINTTSGSGVMGITSDTTSSSRGVYGLASATGGTTYGVVGESASTGGRGVYGLASAGSGTTYGVYGLAHSTNGRAGYFYNNTSGLALVAESETTTGDVFRVYGATSSDVEFRVTGVGNVFADGVFAPGGADFAELLPAAEGLQPGDVLVIGPDGSLALSSLPYQSSVAGAYSTQPGFLGGSGDDNAGKVPLAVVGVVPVKVSAENGPIQPGDLLTASATPGHAMRAGDNPPIGTVIGKALEGLDSGEGVILVLVMLQ